VHAPLPSDFLKLCGEFRLEVRPMEANGGVSIDGVVVENGQVPELKGYWASNEAGLQNPVKYNYNKKSRWYANDMNEVCVLN
jgi:hypothetical protein